MSKHTPSPWTVTHEDDFDGLVIEAAGREGEYVPVACVPVDYDDKLEREANAALIARAPEMAAEIERLTARVGDLVRVLKLADDVLGEDANAQVRLEVSGYIRAAITPTPMEKT